MTWLWILLALVVVAAVLGFGGIIAVAGSIFKIVFWVLLIIFLLGLIFGFMGRRRVII